MADADEAPIEDSNGEEVVFQPIEPEDSVVVDDVAGAAGEEASAESAPGMSPTNPDPNPFDAVGVALQRIETQLTAGDRNAAIIDRLHDEVQQLRHRQDMRRVEPILRAIVHLRDDVQNIVTHAQSSERLPSGEDLVRSLDLFRMQLEETLYREGVDAFAPGAGDRFDGRRHQVVSAVAVANADQDRCVVSVRQPGFVFDERVLRPALVLVGRWTPPSSDAADAAGEVAAAPEAASTEKKGDDHVG